MCSSAVDGLHNALPIPSDSPQVICPLQHYCTPKLPLIVLLQRRGGASIPAAIPRGFLGRSAAACLRPTILGRLWLRKRHLLGDVSPIGLILPVTIEYSVEITSHRLADCESSDHTEAVVSPTPFILRSTFPSLRLLQFYVPLWGVIWYVETCMTHTHARTHARMHARTHAHTHTHTHTHAHTHTVKV